MVKVWKVSSSVSVMVADMFESLEGEDGLEIFSLSFILFYLFFSLMETKSPEDVNWICYDRVWEKYNYLENGEGDKM